MAPPHSRGCWALPFMALGQGKGCWGEPQGRWGKAGKPFPSTRVRMGGPEVRGFCWLRCVPLPYWEVGGERGFRLPTLTSTLQSQHPHTGIRPLTHRGEGSWRWAKATRDQVGVGVRGAPGDDSFQVAAPKCFLVSQVAEGVTVAQECQCLRCGWQARLEARPT